MYKILYRRAGSCGTVSAGTSADDDFLFFHTFLLSYLQSLSTRFLRIDVSCRTKQVWVAGLVIRHLCHARLHSVLPDLLSHNLRFSETEFLNYNKLLWYFVFLNEVSK